MAVRLNLTAAPQTLEIFPGLQLDLLPVSTSVMIAARRDPLVEALPEGSSNEETALAMVKAVARRVVIGWEGVEDEAGAPVPVTPEGIDALLDIWPVFEVFQTRILGQQLLLESEKNG